MLLGPASARCASRRLPSSAAIAWLVTNNPEVGEFAKHCHVLGYDITHIPGPPGKGAMFNFRLLASPVWLGADAVWEGALVAPLPAWHSPPH